MRTREHPAVHFEPGGKVPSGFSSTQIAMTVKQVAAMFGTTPKAVYHRAERGQLPGAFRLGRTLMFRRSDLLRFIAERREPSSGRNRR